MSLTIKKKIFEILLILLVILSSCLLLTDFKKLQNSKSNQNKALIDDKKQQPNISGDHAPINLNGNGALDTFCSGLGTDGLSWSKAHRIENYTIDGQGVGYSIQIRNTDRYLIIRNCTLINAGSLGLGGVFLRNCSNVWIDNCTFINNQNGIHAYTDMFETEKNLIISNNNFSENYNGIYLEYYNDTQIYNNVINGSNNAGLLFSDLCNSIIKYNNISNTQYGLYLHDLLLGSKNNTITNNIFWNINDHEISLSETESSKLHCNEMEKGIEITDSDINPTDSYRRMRSHNITSDNLINGKKVYYYADKNYLSSNNFTDAGQIILVNCNQSKISNLNISYSWNAMDLWHSINNTITSNYFANNYKSTLRLFYSTNNTIFNNTFYNTYRGIYIQSYSHYTNITQNIINRGTGDGITIIDSDFNTISNNNVSYKSKGIFLYISNNNTVSENNVIYNSAYGLFLDYASNNTIYANNCSFNQYGIYINSESYTKSDNNTIWMNWLTNNSNQQAVDDSNEHNKWDNGTVGNYWGDYQKRYPSASHNGLIWNISYSISGSASAEDRFPLVIPVSLSINHPNNITYVFGSIGNKITWIIIDSIVSNPTYAIYLNGVKFDNKSWSTGEPIIIDVDGLGISVNNYTIIVHDGLGEFVTDQVIVTVISAPPPSPSPPPLDDDDDDEEDNNLIMIMIFAITIGSAITGSMIYYIERRKKRSRLVPVKKKKLMEKKETQDKIIEKKIISTMPAKPSKEILLNLIDKKIILEIFNKEDSLEKIAQILNELGITFVSESFLEKVDSFDWEENDKKEFLNEMLSYSPKERQEIIEDIFNKSKLKKNRK